MDLNLTVICGKLAVDAEVQTFVSGARLVRLLVTVSVDHPRKRVDVIPVTYWLVGDEEPDFLTAQRGDRVWVCGSVQRRYWEGVEIVAEQVNLKEVAELV